MKKIFLPGMMAALAFAACTNEDIVSQKTTEAPEVDLSNRPVVGMVDLNFGPQTRLALQDGTFGIPEYEPGKDMIGARLIDVVGGEECEGAHHAEHRYSIADYAWTNYRYDLGTDGKWTSGALMVEGNYMFYVPYNAEALYRTPLEVVFPTTQKIKTLTAKDVPAELNRYSYSSNTEAVDNFYKNGGYTVAVGHTFVDASKEDAGVYVTPEMTQLYAYPQITLVNDYAITKMVPLLDDNGEVVTDGNGEPKMIEEKDENGDPKLYPQDLKIDEITILSSNIMLNGKINHTGLVNALKLDIEEVSHMNNNGQKVVDCEAKTFKNWEDGQQTAWFQQNARTENIATFKTTPYDASKGEKNPDGKITVELEEAVTIKPGQMVTLNVVMPAATYAGSNFKVNVRVLTENEEGEVVRMMFEDHSYVGDGWEEGKSLSYAVAKRYAMEEYNYPADGSDPSPKTSAGALATFKLNGTLIPYDEIEDKPETPSLDEGLYDNDDFLKWLDRITDNSTPKSEADVMDIDHTFKLREVHNVTLDADLIKNVQKYMSNKAATLSFNSYLYVQGSDDAENPLVVDGAKFINFGKVILKGGYIKFLNAKIGEVAYAENSDAVVSYEGGSIGNVSTVNGNVSNATLEGTKIVFCGDLTLTNVIINGEADFDGACGDHTITLNGVTVNGISHLSGKNNIVNNATLNGAVNVNGDATITKLVAATVKLNNGKTITVAGEEAMTWNLEMAKGGKLVVNNENWAPTTVTTGDGKTTVEINVDWAPKSVEFAGTGDKIVDVNAAVDFTGITWDAKNNEENELLSSYTINNYKTITSDLNVPANAVYNQSVKNAAVNGELNNAGTINVNGAIEVEENTGLIIAGSKTDKITVTTGLGKIDNTAGAVVKAGEDQSVYYTISEDFTNADIDAAVKIIDGGINMIVAEGYWTSESDMTTGYKLPDAVKTIKLVGDGERMYLMGKLDFNKAVVYIDGEMSWRGRSTNSAAIVNLDAEYAEGATLSTEEINMTGAYADVLENGGTIVLTDNLELPTTMIVKGNVTVDLNGKTIKAGLFAEDGDGNISNGTTDSYAFWVKQGAKLTINGNGTIETQACAYSIAVWADGGEVVINGGTYKNAGEGSDLIYAKNGGKVIINNGKFIANEKQLGVKGTPELYSALNLHDGTSENSITVVAGEFVNFNPGNNLSENPKVNFVAEGSTLTAVGTKGGEVWTAKNAWTYTYGEIVEKGISNVTYTVTAPVAAN